MPLDVDSNATSRASQLWRWVRDRAREPGSVVAVLGVAIFLRANFLGPAFGLTEDQFELAGVLMATAGWLANTAVRLRVQRELRDRARELVLLSTQVPANVWTTDRDLRLTSVLGTLIQQLENPHLRVPGHTLYELFETQDPNHPAIDAHLRALRGESAHYERTAGELIVEGRVEPLRDREGRVVGCVGVSMDITQRRGMERRNRLLAQALEGASDLISVTDAENRFVYVNQAFLNMYGFTSEEVLGKTPALVNPVESERLEILGGTLRGGWSGDVVNRRKDGSEIPVSLNTTPIRDADGRIVGLLGVARDISERRRAEQALRRSQERFELAARASNEAIWEHDLVTQETWRSGAFETLFGYGAGEAAADEAWWRGVVHPDDWQRVRDSWRRALSAAGPTWLEELRLRRADGSFASVQGRAYVVRDEAGRPVRVIGSLMDVTQRKRAEEVSNRYRALIESSQDAIISLSVDGCIETWNAGAERLYGYRADEVIGRPYSILVPGDLINELQVVLAGLRQGHRIEDYETERLRQDGAVVPVSVTASPVRDGLGRIVGMSGIHRDITERRRAEAASRRLAALVESSQDAIVSTSCDGLVESWNRGAELLYGFTEAEVLGKPISLVMAPERADEMTRNLAAVARGEAAGPYQTERVKKDGTRIAVSVSVSPILDDRGRVVGASGIVRDVSALKRAEAELLESERRLRTVMDRMRLICLCLDTAGRITYCNDYFVELTGWRREDLIGAEYLPKFIPPEVPIAELFHRAVETGEVPAQHENEILTRHGQRRYVRWNNTWLRDAGGGLNEMISVGEDITERRQAEQALARSEETFRLLAEHSTDIITRHAPDGAFLYVSPACRSVLGFDAAELVGHSPYEFIHPDDAAAATPPRDARHGLRAGYAVVFRFRHKDGGYVWLESVGHAEPGPDGAAVLEIRAATRDVTDRMRAQEQLRALARHLESVREEEHTRMAREIHDEVGQALTALRLDASWLAPRLRDAGSAVHRRVEGMIRLADEAIESGRRIVAELRPPILDDLGLVPALEWHLERFARHAGLRYKLTVTPPDLAVGRDLAVMAYRIVQEALTNVARHAKARKVTVQLAGTDGTLSLEIHDDGRGISPDAVASPRAFGLVGMRERAYGRGGSFSIGSAPEGGTTVRVVIPMERRAQPRQAV